MTGDGMATVRTRVCEPGPSVVVVLDCQGPCRTPSGRRARRRHAVQQVTLDGEVHLEIVCTTCRTLTWSPVRAPRVILERVLPSRGPHGAQ
jgi:hypothetical protein